MYQEIKYTLILKLIKKLTILTENEILEKIK